MGSHARAKGAARGGQLGSRRSSHASPRATAPFDAASWECIIALSDISWKATAMDIIRSYTEQTDGSWIEDKEFAIVWHYENADVEYGRMQSAEVSELTYKASTQAVMHV